MKVFVFTGTCVFNGSGVHSAAITTSEAVGAENYGQEEDVARRDERVSGREGACQSPAEKGPSTLEGVEEAVDDSNQSTRCRS